MFEYIISYLLGSINFCWIIGKTLKIDISKFLDGNLGAVNLYNAISNFYKNKSLAIIFSLTGGLLDILKAFIPTILFGPLAGAFAVIGHCFSVFSIIITRKIPSGVGEASLVGYLLGTLNKTLFFILIYLVFYIFVFIFLRKILVSLKIIHISFSIGKIFSLVSFIVFINPENEILFSLTIITITSIVARILRLKNVTF